MQTDEQALEWFKDILANLYQRMLDRGIGPDKINEVLEDTKQK